MAIFSKTKTANPVRQVSAATLETEIDNLTKAFTSTVSKLSAKAKEAYALKDAKEAEIVALQTECTNLDAVGSRANNIAEKISSLFN